ncbi:phytoene desaturase family protein [Methanobacterium sp. ACI-7]|uniref:phytoene desaturase family protein n=1 Tax=unclassified Methanobacterium TaxID=2627676 RepID=UPI0039C4135C
MTKKIIIIGGGIAGLSTGIYARINGYDTTIFEKHSKTGGLCTSWSRKGFTFDYCIHNLAGTGNVRLREVWDDLGAFEGAEIINHEVFTRVEDSRGNVLNVYTDLSRLERHMKEIAPEDSKVIEEYVKTGKSLSGADFFAMNMGGAISKLKIAPHLPKIMKWGQVNLNEYAEKFSNDFLKKAFPHVQYNISGSEIPMFAHLLFLSGFNVGDLGWPKGGSIEFSRRIAKRFTDLGGELNKSSKVEKIIVEDDNAVGVILANGKEYRADIVISAADGHETIYEMLDGKYTNETIDKYYQSYIEEQAFGLQVFLGLNRDLQDEPHAISLLLDEPIKLELKKINSLYLELFDDSSGVVPENKSVIKVVTDGTYDYWKKMREENLEKYRNEKEKVYQKVLEVLEKRFPGIKEQVEVYDVTTPVTVERYTFNFHGWQPWPVPDGGMKTMMSGLSKTLPGLKNFYMVGQWASAMIGVSNAAVMGRSLIKELCKRDKKKFKTR